ncbi:MAG TPA: cytochrome o ubiquinol oxidase subunit I [Nevskiaceae bacterium]|nr:cytochrome o ubiquinol oxidase subunit I [Nevskiaceae bacterium]
MTSDSAMHFLFGRLTLHSIPYDVPILVWTFVVVAILGIAILALVTYYRQWGYLWSEWFTSIDHKKIGIMYMVLATVMLVRGFGDAIMMRIQQATAFGGHEWLPPEHYDQLFSVHGDIMILFMAMPFVVGLFNLVLPLQLGARDVAFPRLNNFSFWMTVSGAVLIMLSLFVGNFDRAGWLAFPPLSELKYSPDVGVDYFIWALQLAGVGTLLSGVNFIVTIVKNRAPGMTLMKMPMFGWCALCTNILIVAAFPALTASLALLGLDRYLDMHFFTNSAGGDMMMYVNLIWIWGHPEVYILIIPLFGVYSEIVPTFSGKPLFGYASMVYATMAIAIMSYLVWLHHFFTMGAGPSVNSFFAISSMIIAIPTGVKLFNWLFTMYRGRVRFTVPMMWTLGFMFTFTIGGMTGVMLAVAPADFVLHNSLFLVAHFHNVIIGGVVFGIFAGINYWAPKYLGFKLDEFWGKVCFWCWLVGFWVAFTPLYVMGLMGITRRENDFVTDPSLQIWFVIALIGAIIIFAGIVAFLVQIGVSIKNREKLRDVTGDPWDGRTLEWATSSPPPAYNFAFTPLVHERDEWLYRKQNGYVRPTGGFNPIHMPKNTTMGIVLSALSLICGFGLVWHIWWMVAISFALLVISVIAYSFNYRISYHLSAEDVMQEEDRFTRALAQQEQPA